MLSTPPDAITEIIESTPAESIVAFDLDNTILNHDSGEATTVMLARLGLLDGAATREEMHSGEDLFRSYRDQLLTAGGDSERVADIYRWLVTLQSGLLVEDVVNAAESVMRDDGWSAAAAPRPTLRRSIAEIIARFQRHHAHVVIVSASDIWSVRCAIHHLLNPELERLGGSALQIPAVFGMSLSVRGGEQIPTSGSLNFLEDRSLIAGARLGNTLSQPTTCYGGKRELLESLFPHRIIHAAFGDSRNDYEMLRLASNGCFLPLVSNHALREELERIKKGWDAAKRLVVQPVTEAGDLACE